MLYVLLLVKKINICKYYYKFLYCVFLGVLGLMFGEIIIVNGIGIEVV